MDEQRQRADASRRLRTPRYDGRVTTLLGVLDDIRTNGETTRADISARTGLGRALVNQRLGELLELPLIAGGDLGVSTGGGPPPPGRPPSRARPPRSAGP